MFEIMRAAIYQRCWQITTVFNGLFDCEVDPNSVMNGEISGSYASTHSTLGHVLTPQIEAELRVDQPQLVTASTWLEIEEDDDETALRLTFESANLLAWHELCHLANPAQVREMLRSVSLPAHAGQTDKVHAREVVIDALAMLMGRIMYAHPVTGQSIPRTETQRKNLMTAGLLALTKRVSQPANAPIKPGQRTFMLRLAAELETEALNGSSESEKGLKRLMRMGYAPMLEKGRELQEAYATLYGYVLSVIDVTNMEFRSSVTSWTEDVPSHVIPINRTLH
ncbi:MAG: hypothetical protein PHC53_05225 [Patescibacteria group bacterium]|nr:hypothetical protein [Patescibacteria group bacterium]